MNPHSIKGIVDTSITSRLQQITSDMEAMISTCRFILVASNTTFIVLNSKHEDSVRSQEKLSEHIDAALQHQKNQMLKLIDRVLDYNVE